jgi:hypothetical protein
LQGGLLRRSKEVGISSVVLALRGASPLAFPAVAAPTLGLSVGLPAIGSGPTVAIAAIVSLSAFIHGILLAMPHPTTRER